MNHKAGDLFVRNGNLYFLVVVSTQFHEQEFHLIDLSTGLSVAECFSKIGEIPLSLLEEYDYKEPGLEYIGHISGLAIGKK